MPRILKRVIKHQVKRGNQRRYVHAYGKASILNEEELKQDLRMLLEKYEKHRENPVLLDNLSPEVLQQLTGIVGFKIKVQEFQGANKLSQNRNEKDYCNIVDKLNNEEDLHSHQVSEVMKNRQF